MTILSKCLICSNKIDNGILCELCTEDLGITGSRHCINCGKNLSSEESYCFNCREGLSICNQTLYPYYGNVRFLIYLLKYRLDSEVIAFWAEKLYEYLGKLPGNYCLVPIPCRPENRKRRGGDGMELICRYLKRHYGIPFKTILKRRRFHISQKKLGSKERKQNIRNQFIVKGKINEDTIILLDDVSTTCATLRECYRIVQTQKIQIKSFTLARD